MRQNKWPLGQPPSIKSTQHQKLTTHHLAQCQHHQQCPLAIKLAGHYPSSARPRGRHHMPPRNKHKLDNTHHPNCRTDLQQVRISSSSDSNNSWKSCQQQQLSTGRHINRSIRTVDSMSHWVRNRYLWPREVVSPHTSRIKQHQLHHCLRIPSWTKTPSVRS